MINTQFIDEISSKINTLISSSPAADIEQNLHALLRGVFTRMDLVTREEFDIQSQLLLQARNKLDVLERKLTAIEALAVEKD